MCNIRSTCWICLALRIWLRTAVLGAQRGCKQDCGYFALRLLCPKVFHEKTAALGPAMVPSSLAVSASTSDVAPARSASGYGFQQCDAGQQCHAQQRPVGMEALSRADLALRLQSKLWVVLGMACKRLGVSPASRNIEICARLVGHLIEEGLLPTGLS